MFYRWRGNGYKQRQQAATLLGIVVFFYVFAKTSIFLSESRQRIVSIRDLLLTVETEIDWDALPQHFPLDSILLLPQERPATIPLIQHRFDREDPEARALRYDRLRHVKEEFIHAWTGYKRQAKWHDEIKPVSGRYDDPFGAWGATLVDSLDTLWIMGMKEEFDLAVQAVMRIDFSVNELEEINLFETTIRHLGGLLSAYDLSEGRYPGLLAQAVSLGTMLYAAFDSPNRMPVNHWRWKLTSEGQQQSASSVTCVAEIGSLTLEFTRLSQLTQDSKWYDAVQRIMDAFDSQQNDTKLPGMWPVNVNPFELNFVDDQTFSLGGQSDSLYEYLPKQHLLLGGVDNQYRRMYEGALTTMKDYIFFRPMTVNYTDILFPAIVHSDGSEIPPDRSNHTRAAIGDLPIDYKVEHLACFAGGMVGISSRIFPTDTSDEDLELARKLMEGCLWAYENMPAGIMPDSMHLVPCASTDHCPWIEARWLTEIKKRDREERWEPRETVRDEKLIEGVARWDDRSYRLRPEAVESIFILYRLTGDTTLQDRAYALFKNMIKHTKTIHAHASLRDVTTPLIHGTAPQLDKCESFWLAETLKYFYLMFEEPDVVSLDEFVFNTEAHPFRRPV